MSQEKLQTMVMQKSWGVIEVFMGLCKIVNGLFFLYANVLFSQFEPLFGLQRDTLFVKCF